MVLTLAYPLSPALSALTQSRSEPISRIPIRLLRRNQPDMTAVVFLYLPAGIDPVRPDIDRVNAINKGIHQRILEGRWHLHQFSLPDDTGRLAQDAVLYPLRFMGNNTRITEAHMRDALDYVNGIGRQLETTL